MSTYCNIQQYEYTAIDSIFSIAMRIHGMKGYKPMREQIIKWLYENAGPIIRWRLIRDFGIKVSETESRIVKQAVLESEEVRRWLDNLGGPSVHGSKDTDAENAMAKLIEYGLKKGMAEEFDAKMLSYAERVTASSQGIDNLSFITLMAGPFLIAAGFGSDPKVRSYFRRRLHILRDKAVSGVYDIYMPVEDKGNIPSAWRNNPVYKPEFYAGRVVRLPMCYDLYALSHWPASNVTERAPIDDVINYLSAPLFQDTQGGFLWDKAKKTCYAAGRVVLACLTEERKILFLELTAKFEQCREKQWFRDALAELERHRTWSGTYCFPPEYLAENKNKSYLYRGGHMGLGEDRRYRKWREIESTFRMLNIKRLMAGDHPSNSGGYKI